MERNVVSLKTAKKLKAAGFPQAGVFAWRQSLNTLYQGRPFVDMPIDSGADGLIAYAPTAQEIANELPDYAKVFRRNKREQPRWCAGSVSLAAAMPEYYNGHVWYYAETMAEALATLYIKLKQNDCDHADFADTMDGSRCTECGLEDVLEDTAL